MSTYTRLPPLNHSGSENRPIRERRLFVHTTNPPGNLQALKTALEIAGFFSTGSAGCYQSHMEVLDSDYPMCSCLQQISLNSHVFFLMILVQSDGEETAPKADQHQFLLLANSILQFLLFSQSKFRVQASILGY